MVRFEARSDGDVVVAQLRVEVRPLIVFVGRLTALISAITGLLVAISQFGRAVGWW